MVTALLGGFCTTAAFALHLQLTDSAPKKDQTVADTVSTIRLWFNENPSLAVSRIAIEGPGGEVATEAVAATDDPKSFATTIKGALLPGSHTVSWRTAGSDGHVLRGEYQFVVAEGDNR